MKPTTKLLIGATLIASVVFLVVGILIGHFAIKHNPPVEETITQQPVEEQTIHEPQVQRMPDEEVRKRLFDEIRANNIRKYMMSLTNHSHAAGTIENDNVAEYIHNAFQTFGLEHVHYANYEVLLSRPNETNPNLVKVVDASNNDVLVLRNKEDLPNGSKPFDSSFFAYSPQGLVESDTLIYANLARDEDFRNLTRRGFNITGSIILARMGGPFRGDKVEIAAKYGAKAVLLYLDPFAVAPYGINDSMVYPNTQWMPSSAMERGSVLLSKGDPQSMGFVSEPDDRTPYRTPVDKTDLPKIPSTPIGYGDAQRLFNLMTNSTPVPSSWRISKQNMKYALGGKLSDQRKISVSVTNYPVQKNIRNIIGSIQGCEEPDRYVILGNHYDAWTMGGIDPNSGTSTLLELARSAGHLRTSTSWCPRRSIIFAAWDAEEYGLIGSTEWVEENLQILSERTVAYINIDAAVRGRISFRALSMPLLNQIIFSATKQVQDPSAVGSSNASVTVYDVWARNDTPTVARLSAGSDYANFVNMVGITSADIRYVGEKSNPAYHTAFETFEYVDQHIDPGFTYHAAMGKVWMEIVRDLSEAQIIPFWKSIPDLVDDIAVSWNKLADEIAQESYNFTAEIHTNLLTDAINYFNGAATKFVNQISAIQNTNNFTKELARQLNDKQIKLERMFVDPSGLPGRPLVRHVLQAPSKANSYGSSSFAGIGDSIAFAKEGMEEKDDKKTQYWLTELKVHYTKVVQMVRRAARFLAAPVVGIDGGVNLRNGIPIQIPKIVQPDRFAYEV